jgi:uncharacterized protein
MTDRRMDVILIPSTHCNLRCSYCYELTRLADKRRMTLDALEVVFERVAEFFEEQRVTGARFIWHGGEPLLLPPAHYRQAFELQKKHFSGAATRIENVTQTNLTVLDDERIELLRDGFDSCGVSLDLFGSLRVNAAGTCREQVALANLERARAAGVLLGGVTVLTRANRARTRAIFEFYRQRDMGFRLLPLHAGDFGAGQWFEIGPEDTLRAFCTLADLWLANPDAPAVHPITEVIDNVFSFHSEGRACDVYDKATWDPMLAIDREGFVYSYDDIHDRTRSYGNLLEQSLSALMKSPMHQASVVETERRARETCFACPSYGRTCTGIPIVEGARDYWRKNADGSLRCDVFTGLVAHVEARLESAGASLDRRFRQPRRAPAVFAGAIAP